MEERTIMIIVIVVGFVVWAYLISVMIASAILFKQMKDRIE